MLIKSQDRKMLMDISGMTIAIAHTNTERFDIIATNEYIVLGSYQTEQRAIEIIDKISLHYRNYSMGNAGDRWKFAVYEMPEE